MTKAYLRAAAPAALVLLGACGGGGGGGAGPEPTPPPPAAASAFPLSSSGSFSTISGYRSYTRPPGTNIAVDRFGTSGRSSTVTISYDASTNSYTVKDAAGSASFNSSHLASNGHIDTYSKPQEGAFVDKLQLYNNVRSGASQASAPVQLSYMSYGVWSRTDLGTLDKHYTTYFLFGYPTSLSSMPKTGSATYQTAVTGNLVDIFQATGEQAVGGSATFTANFGNATVNTDLTLNIASNSALIGTFNGTGAISGSQFSGNFASSDPYFVNGSFAGGFFGPIAGEMGYTFAIERGAWDPYAGATVAPGRSWITGAVVGKKN